MRAAREPFATYTRKLGVPGRSKSVPPQTPMKIQEIRGISGTLLWNEGNLVCESKHEAKHIPVKTIRASLSRREEARIRDHLH